MIKEKKFILETSTLRGKDRRIVMSGAPKMKFYPDEYHEDWDDFPITLSVNTKGKIPIVYIDGNCIIYYKGEKLNGSKS